MNTVRDQRRKQAKYVAECHEKKRRELLRQAVSAELRRAAQESLTASAANGTPLLVCGRQFGLAQFEYGTVFEVETNILYGDLRVKVAAYPMMKDGRRIDTRYIVSTLNAQMRTVPSSFRGVIATELVAGDAVLRSCRL